MAKVWEIKKLKALNQEEKKQMLQDAYDLGFKYEHDYHGCSQASFGALQELFGISEPMAFKAATGLAGGFGGSVEGMCGALSGCGMFYSMLYGRERDKIEDPNRVRAIAISGCNRLREKFLEEWGSATCREIMAEQMRRTGKGRQWFRLSVPEEFESFVKAGGHTESAPDVVGKACRWAVELIIEKETAGK
jgi:C_GCAxxG_C_C family probable redox protein